MGGYLAIHRTPQLQQASRMKKSELIKHLFHVAQKSSSRKRLTNAHVKTIVSELTNVWSTALRDDGRANIHDFGRFEVDSRTGRIKFKASSTLEKKLAGEVEMSSSETEPDRE